MLRAAVTWLACSAAYGYALGTAHSELYAARNLVKLPLLFAVTGVVCSLAYFVVARAVGAPLSFLAVQRATWRLFHDLAVLLASLAPVVLFLALVARHSDDGQLGQYDLFLALNMLAVAVAGTLALARQSRGLFEEHRLEPPRARLLVGTWLLLTLMVGGQAAFWMRPFFGFPITRGYAAPPFFLKTEPDLRGASNFFEAVLQTIEHPALPEWLKRADD